MWLLSCSFLLRPSRWRDTMEIIPAQIIGHDVDEKCFSALVLRIRRQSETNPCIVAWSKFPMTQNFLLSRNHRARFRSCFRETSAMLWPAASCKMSSIALRESSMNSSSSSPAYLWRSITSNNTSMGSPSMHACRILWKTARDTWFFQSCLLNDHILLSIHHYFQGKYTCKTSTYALGWDEEIVALLKLCQ